MGGRSRVNFTGFLRFLGNWLPPHTSHFHSGLKIRLKP